MPDTATRAKTHSKNPGNSFIFHYMKLIRSVPLIQIGALKDLSLLLKGTRLLRTKNRYCIQRGENHYQGNHSQDFALSRGHSLTLWARPTRQAWNLTRHTVSIEPGYVPTLPHIHLPAITMASTLLQGLATGKPRSNTCAALNYNASYPTVRRWIPWRENCIRPYVFMCQTLKNFWGSTFRNGSATMND